MLSFAPDYYHHKGNNNNNNNNNNTPYKQYYFINRLLQLILIYFKFSFIFSSTFSRVKLYVTFFVKTSKKEVKSITIRKDKNSAKGDYTIV